MELLLERRVGGRRLVAIASDRGDGDVHPRRVGADELAARQRALTGARWVMVDQVHGTAVARPGGCPPWPLAGRGDVVVRAAADPAPAPVAIWTADCAAVALFGAGGSIVMFHAGWRGLAAGIVAVALDAMRVAGETVVASVLGPAIHPCCYEFGAADLGAVADGLGVAAREVRAMTSTSTLALDVPGAIRAGLHRGGVDLDVAGPCTGCDPRWFSYRARGDRGRHALVAWTDTDVTGVAR